MANETKVQAFIHALEEGGWVSRIRLILLLAAIATVYVIVILSQFKGLSNDKGMDQAQIGRQLASGHGFTTKFLRPIAYSQFVNHFGAFPTGDIPDTYNAPLNPFVDSLLLRLTRSSWPMTDKDIVYTSDRVIAGASLLFFISPSASTSPSPSASSTAASPSSAWDSSSSATSSGTSPSPASRRC
jgi:hypothetical protein